jgi:hypothetical protein
VTPGIFIGVANIRDRLAFWLWYPTHRQLVDEWMTKDGIIVDWDGWGMAGMENDSYLVSNPDDMISTVDLASQWSLQHANGCEVVGVQRMRRSLYILTTYNCPFR